MPSRLEVRVFRRKLRVSFSVFSCSQGLATWNDQFEGGGHRLCQGISSLWGVSSWSHQSEGRDLAGKPQPNKGDRALSLNFSGMFPSAWSLGPNLCWSQRQSRERWVGAGDPAEPSPPLGLLCGECPGLATWLQEASLAHDWGEGVTGERAAAPSPPGLPSQGACPASPHRGEWRAGWSPSWTPMLSCPVHQPPSSVMSEPGT